MPKLSKPIKAMKVGLAVVASKSLGAKAKGKAKTAMKAMKRAMKVAKKEESDLDEDSESEVTGANVSTAGKQTVAYPAEFAMTQKDLDSRKDMSVKEKITFLRNKLQGVPPEAAMQKDRTYSDDAEYIYSL